MSNFIPTIGVSGLYSLLAPFTTDLLPEVAYTCIAVRRLSDIVAVGGEPFTDYYEPKSISEEDYAADVAAGVCIVSLQASDENIVYVPSSYITGLPNIGGVPYTTLALGIKLGPLPDSLNLSLLKNKLSDVVFEYIGITPEIETIAISLPTLLDRVDAATLEAARTAAITAIKTDYTKYLEEKALRESAILKIAALEEYIRDNLPPAP